MLFDLFSIIKVCHVAVLIQTHQYILSFVIGLDECRYVLMCIHFLQQRKPAILPCLQVSAAPSMLICWVEGICRIMTTRNLLFFLVWQGWECSLTTSCGGGGGVRKSSGLFSDCQDQTWESFNTGQFLLNLALLALKWVGFEVWVGAIQCDRKCSQRTRLLLARSNVLTLIKLTSWRVLVNGTKS